MSDHFRMEIPDACELKSVLERSLSEAHRTLSKKTVLLQEARTLLFFMKKTRVLLLELHHTTQCSDGNEDVANAVDRVRKSFVKLTEESAAIASGERRKMKLETKKSA